MAHIFFDESHWPEEAAALRALDSTDDALVLGLDLAAPADGIAQMIEARRGGKTIALLPLLRDPLEELTGKIWASVASANDAEQRLTYIAAMRTDQLTVEGGLKPSASAVLPAPIKNAAGLALRLADILLLGSAHEADRWSNIAGRAFRRVALLPAPARTIVGALDERRITVYAPSTPRSQLQDIDLIVATRKLDAVFITAENPKQTVTTRIVVAPEWWHSLRARTLAAAGHKVVAPNHTALHEQEPNVFSYAPADLYSLEGAIDAARAASAVAPSQQTTAAALQQRIEAEHPAIERGPLISIIVRTYDRAHLLERSIASIVAQTYENVEIVVVNNGGPDVRELVERAARDRMFQYVVMPERLHIGAASNVGAKAARGEYIGYLDDDDLLYADHCARAVDVLERTRADVAYTICMAEYADMSSGTKRVLGFQIFLDREFNRDALYVTNVTPIHSAVHRRDLFDRFGYFDETLPVTDDWEFWLRTASRGGTFVHVDRVTCEYSWRHDPRSGNMTMTHQQQFADSYGKIIARYAKDVVGRTGLLNAQQQTLNGQIQNAKYVAENPAQAGIGLLNSMLVHAVPVAPVPEPDVRTRVLDARS